MEGASERSGHQPERCRHMHDCRMSDESTFHSVPFHAERVARPGGPNPKLLYETGGNSLRRMAGAVESESVRALNVDVSHEQRGSTRSATRCCYGGFSLWSFPGPKNARQLELATRSRPSGGADRKNANPLRRRVRAGTLGVSPTLFP